jgi:hypothetical protein
MAASTTEKGAGTGGGAESYCVISIDPTSAPRGNTGGDWLVYRLGQGDNVVTGYRRGSRLNVTAEVERLVVAFNERLLLKGRSSRSGGRPRKPPLPKKKAS